MCKMKHHQERRQPKLLNRMHHIKCRFASQQNTMHRCPTEIRSLVIKNMVQISITMQKQTVQSDAKIKIKQVDDFSKGPHFYKLIKRTRISIRRAWRTRVSSTVCSLDCCILSRQPPQYKSVLSFLPYQCSDVGLLDCHQLLASESRARFFAVRHQHALCCYRCHCGCCSHVRQFDFFSAMFSSNWHRNVWTPALFVVFAALEGMFGPNAWCILTLESSRNLLCRLFQP